MNLFTDVIENLHKATIGRLR